MKKHRTTARRCIGRNCQCIPMQTISPKEITVLIRMSQTDTTCGGFGYFGVKLDIGWRGGYILPVAVVCDIRISTELTNHGHQ